MDIQTNLKVGLSLQKEFLVEDKHTAAHIGSGSIKVLATPMMIAYIEITARTLLDNYLPEGYSTVGTHVDIRHLAPTAMGKLVEARVEINQIEDKKVILGVSVWEGERKVGGGTHERYVIEVERFLKRIK